MFQPRSRDFDPRVGAIAGHLRAIEKELTRLGGTASRRASVGAAAAGDQIADTLGPILSDLAARFRRGQRVAVDEATSFGNEAVRMGASLGGDALDSISAQTKLRPLLTLAVALGVGILIGAASRRN